MLAASQDRRHLVGPRREAPPQPVGSPRRCRQRNGEPIRQTCTDRYIEQGVQQCRADMRLRLIERRFDPPIDQVRERVTQADPGMLLQWYERTLDAGELDDLWH